MNQTDREQKALAAADRCLHPLAQYARAPRTRIEVAPGDQAVVKGEDAAMVGLIERTLGGALERRWRDGKKPFTGPGSRA